VPSIGGLLLATAALAIPLWWPVNLVQPRIEGLVELESALALNVPDIPLLLFLLVRLVEHLRSGQRASIAWQQVVGVLCLPAAAVLSAVQATYPLLSLAAGAHLLLLALVWLAAQGSPRVWRWLAAGLLVGASIEAGLAVAQSITQTSLVPSVLVLPWSEVEWIRSIDPGQPGTPVVIALDGLRWLRAFGTFPHPNVLGGYLAMSLVVLGLVESKLSRAWRWLAPVVGALLTAGLLASLSRAAVLAALLGLGAVWLLQHPGGRPRRVWFLGPVAGALVMLVPLAGAVPGRLVLPAPNPIEEASVETRISLVSIGLQEWLAHPWFGTGAGNFALVSLLDGLQASPPQPVHNVGALIVVETGLPGALAELWLAFLVVRAIRRPPGRAAPGLAIAAALVPLAAFDHYLWTMGPPRVLVCLVAILASDFGTTWPQSSVSPRLSELGSATVRGERLAERAPHASRTNASRTFSRRLSALILANA
jgi:O-antigen ligase/polysaccharide polymerase Wzy-like membrane protein